MCSCCANDTTTDNALVPPKWYSQTEFSNCEAYFPCTDYCCSCKCCYCCPQSEPLSECRISLAWLIESPAYKQVCTPFGWEINLVDTESEINRTCNDFIEWVNCPPCGKCNGHNDCCGCSKKRAITYQEANCINNCLCHCLNNCCCMQRPPQCNCTNFSCKNGTKIDKTEIKMKNNDGTTCSICGDHMTRPDLCICPCCHLPIKPEDHEVQQPLPSPEPQPSSPSPPSTPNLPDHPEPPVRLSSSKTPIIMPSKHQIQSKSKHSLFSHKNKSAISAGPAQSRHIMSNKSKVTLANPISQSIRRSSSPQYPSSDSSVSQVPPSSATNAAMENPPSQNVIEKEASPVPPILNKSMNQLYENDTEYFSNYVTLNTALTHQPNQYSYYPISESKKNRPRNAYIQCELLVESPDDPIFDYGSKPLYGNQRNFQNYSLYDYKPNYSKKKKKCTNCNSKNKSSRSKYQSGAYFYDNQASYDYASYPRKQTKPKSLCFCDKVNVRDIPCNDFYL